MQLACKICLKESLKLILVTYVELPLKWRKAVVAIGSGGNFAQAAAIAMTRHSNGMSASEIAKEAVKIASGIDVFTDDHITTDEI